MSKRMSQGWVEDGRRLDDIKVKWTAPGFKKYFESAETSAGDRDGGGGQDPANIGGREN